MTRELSAHPHSTTEAWEVAQRGTVLLTQVGSRVHGCAVDGQDDRDEMGVCVEPPEYVVGLRRFEQYEYRTQPQGARSGPGDLDLVVYSLRKWARLALQGNPTVLLPLFVPEAEVVRTDRVGRYMRERPDLFLSRQAGARFVGYLRSQRERLMGLKPSRRRTNRPELVEKYGFDTKYAYHMVRLGLQGVELRSTGRITVPIPEDDRRWLVDLRRGLVSQEDALYRAAELEREVEALIWSDVGPLPAEPDRGRVDLWLYRTYQDAWNRWPE